MSFPGGAWERSCPGASRIRRPAVSGSSAGRVRDLLTTVDVGLKTPIVAVVNSGDVRTSVDAMRLGAVTALGDDTFSITVSWLDAHAGGALTTRRSLTTTLRL